MTVRRTELISMIATRGIQPEVAEKVIKVLFDLLADHLAHGREVAVINFGKFYVRDLAATTINDPKTGQPRPVPQHSTVGFKPADRLKRKVNS